jgi:branched-chain amino acid transport system substrate-binding protein
MKTRLLGATAAALCLLASNPSSAAGKPPPDKIKIGFITTLSGPQAVMGTQMKDSADLALEMLGGKLGGIPAEIVYGDDQQKPDVGRQLADRMVKKDNVDFVSGLLASHILLAVYQELIKSKTIMVSANAGPHEIAGKMCSPYFFSTASQNDQSPQAMGEYMNRAKITDVYIMAPNYAAGKDMLAGFKRSFKGNIIGETYTTFGQSDYQAELSQVRAAHPKAIFVFYPGGMGIQFVKQFAASGLKDTTPLYSVYTADATNLVQMKDAAVGNYDVSFWNADLDTPRSKQYVAAFRKKYGYTPSNYGADSFDAVFLIDSAVRAVEGDVSNKKGLIDAMQKADFSSVRGSFSYNVNHFPIQNFYLLKVVKDGAGDPEIRIDQQIAADNKDPYFGECKMTAP